MEIWEPKPPRTLWATPGLLRDCFTFTFTIIVSHYEGSNLQRDEPSSPIKGMEFLD